MFPPGSMPSFPTIYSLSWRKWGAAQGESELQDEPTRIRRALIQSGGNVVRAARLLGLSRDAVRYRMRHYGIQRPLSELSSPLVGEPFCSRFFASGH